MLVWNLSNISSGLGLALLNFEQCDNVQEEGDFVMVYELNSVLVCDHYVFFPLRSVMCIHSGAAAISWLVRLCVAFAVFLCH